MLLMACGGVRYHANLYRPWDRTTICTAITVVEVARNCAPAASRMHIQMCSVLHAVCANKLSIIEMAVSGDPWKKESDSIVTGTRYKQRDKVR